MRARTTWNQQEILTRAASSSPTAATTRTADPYAMNQDHLKQQPPGDKYLTGDPSAFAEDVTTPNNWEVEYSGGAVKRDEIGLPEDRPDTFNHPERTASMSHDLLLKKADLSVRIARRMLGTNAPETAIEEQAATFMRLPDAEVINTYNRLANEMPPQLQKAQEQQAAKKESEDEVQEQAKQAALRGDKKAFDVALTKLVGMRKANDPQQQAPAQQQQQQAGQQQDQQQQAGQQQSAWYDTNAPRPGHPGKDTGPHAGQQQQAQGQQQMPPAQQQQQSGQQQMPPAQQQSGQQQTPPDHMQQQAQGQQPQGVEAQVQQMIEQAAQQMQMQARHANGQQMPPAQQQQAGQQQQQAGQQQAGQGQGQQMPPAQQQQQSGQQQQAGQGQQMPPAQQQQAGQGQQMPPAQQQACGPMMQQASDDALIDQLLMPGGGGSAPAPGSIAEMDIQMEAPSMDIGDVSFQPGEDDMLRQLFSNDEAMAAQQAQQQGQDQGQQGQQVQANIRTAALRTVGTRPTAGVSRIGGAGAPPSRGQDVDKLTSLWASAPDVREVFGLKTT
jgi:hypothetical protein